MRHLWWIVLIVLIMIPLSACSGQKTCKKPFFEFVEGQCCIDENDNEKCDRDETQIQEETSVEQPNESVKEEPPSTVKVKEVEEKVEETKTTELNGTTSEAAGEKPWHRVVLNFEKKVRSVAYTLKDNKVYVKPPYMSIELENLVQAGETEKEEIVYVDTVYLDPANRVAKGGCEANKEFDEDKCAPIWRKLVDMSFPKYIHPTPFDWITRLRNGKVLEFIPKSEKVEQRIVDYVKFEEQNELIELWADGNSVRTEDVLPVLPTSSVQVIG
ncbi:hypothetical protein J4457_00675 [Candidatus Woesearchaeota archaeon]|nr:hypothetical protein [Candidatus Woesearchaeota archaeon]